jgi:hypothetical protein
MNVIDTEQELKIVEEKSKKTAIEQLIDERIARYMKFNFKVMTKKR